MGFFSWNCKRCGHPMLSPWSCNKINSWMIDVAVIESDGRVLKGEYDGYGRVGAVDINIDLIYQDDGPDQDPDCYHQACHEMEGQPTTYAGGSDNAPDQGFFFGKGSHDMACPVEIYTRSDESLWRLAGVRAIGACKALCIAYAKGELNGGSMEWDDVDHAWQHACKALDLIGEKPEINEESDDAGT